MKKFAYMIIFVLSLMITTQVSASTNKNIESTFNFKTVYEFNIATYEKIQDFDKLEVELLNDKLLELRFNGNIYTDIKYEKTFEEEFNTTAIVAKDEKQGINLRIVYDKRENANGNLIIYSLEDENNETLIKDTKEKFIRFANEEKIDLKSLVSGIQGEVEQKSISQANIQPMASDLPVVKSYKYGKYMYGGVFWNTSYIATGNSVVQLKFTPLFGNLNSWKDPYGRTGTLIKNQSEIISTTARYRFIGNGAIGNTRPNLDNVNNPKYITIKLSYRGIGASVKLPISSKNSVSPGTDARWSLNSQYTALQNSNGDLDKYHLEGITTITGAGKTTQVATTATIRIGALYRFGDIPVQDVILTDTLTFPTFSATVKAE